MPAAKSAVKTFDAVLERTPDRLRWVIARLPFDAAKSWSKRGQLRIKGEINASLSAVRSFPPATAHTFSSSTRNC
jgi:hypothetical protein